MGILTGLAASGHEWALMLGLFGSTRARGRRGGRPSVLTGNKPQVARELYASGQYTVAAIAKTLGVSRASIYRHLSKADSRLGPPAREQVAPKSTT
jgi:DNA invertase Pin-like site-specific DNA recombinase